MSSANPFMLPIGQPSKNPVSLTFNPLNPLSIDTIISVIAWSYVAAFHNHQIIALFLNRFFYATNDTMITATLMSQFGRDGLSGAAYSMMNTIGNLSTVPACWFLGKLLDLTGESLACWSGIFITMAIGSVIILLLYSFCLESEPITIPPTGDQVKEKEGKNVQGIQLC